MLVVLVLVLLRLRFEVLCSLSLAAAPLLSPGTPRAAVARYGRVAAGGRAALGGAGVSQGIYTTKTKSRSSFKDSNGGPHYIYAKLPVVLFTYQ